LVFWLLPCALQDYRTRHVSNWLTVPLFVLAWPVALLTDNLPLTFAVFAGVFVAWRWGGGLGPADGKLMVGLAAFAPWALGVGVALEAIVFAVLRLRGNHETAIPGALWLYIGSLVAASLTNASYAFEWRLP
jgi:Flp pilus assembly protein protease CpaA